MVRRCHPLLLVSRAFLVCCSQCPLGWGRPCKKEGKIVAGPR